ncbi:nucleotidyltransferase family protein [Baaleninema sp.]|uniref:nucleotidyltransferase family protein n=1 Tax=Baaleninema sp. TaxID=3101197 RepID=UPI003D049FD4
MFSSILREDFNENSDIDILVEFQPGYVPGFGFIDIQDEIQDELSRLFDRTVDLNTPDCLNPYFRDRVSPEAQVLNVV